MESTVYFSDLRATGKKNIFRKLELMLDQLSLRERVKKGYLVALKVHFGERGNTAYVRPVFVQRVVSKIKGLKAKPFLTDTNTLYVGSRGDSAQHLETVFLNGFDFSAVDAPVIIGGGLRGNRCQSVTVGLRHFRTVEIAYEIADADAVIGITHFKGHEMSGFGGTLKNFGMGTASRMGKLNMHSNANPFIKAEVCSGCGNCLAWCAFGALTMEGSKAGIQTQVCTGCGACIPTCPEKAIRIAWNQGVREMQEKMVEYAYGALFPKKDRSIFLNFLMNITPLCDCYPFSDTPIVPDIGIVASEDPVAVDQASVDLVNLQTGNPNSSLQGGHAPGEDKFRGAAPDIDWQLQLRYGEEIGLGRRAYRLVKV